MASAPAEINFTRLAALPVFNPLNYTTLPRHLLDYYATGYSLLMKDDAINLLYLTFLSSPSVTRKRTLDLFHVSHTQIVQHIIGLICQLEPIKCDLFQASEPPIAFETNVLTAAGPRVASLHLAHSALHNLLAYIEDSNLSEAIAERWFAILDAQMRNPAAHTCLPEHPSAVMRNFANITSPFAFSRRDVSEWLVMSSSPHRYSDSVFSVSGTDVQNQIVCVNFSSFTITFDNAEGGFVAIPIDDTFEGTFLSLVLLFKYFVLFVQKPMIRHRHRLYEMLIMSLIAGSPYFVQFHRQFLELLGRQMPVLLADMTAPFIRTLNLLALYQALSPSLKSFLSEQRLLFEERSLLGMKAAFPEFQTQSDIDALSELTDLVWDLPSPWLPPVLTIPSNDVQVYYSNIRRIFSPRDSIIDFPFHFLIVDWASSILTAPPFKTTLRQPNVIEIEFTVFVPVSAELQIDSDVTVLLEPVDQSKAVSPIRGQFDPPLVPFLLQLPDGETWAAHEFAFLSPMSRGIIGKGFVVANRARFIDDMKAWITIIKPSVDQMILSALGGAAAYRKD
jgi:hypothetical protein